jgi:hypothetical protein
MSICLRRREFVTLLSGAAVSWPAFARAQQPTMPAIGFLRSASFADATPLVDAFRQGLKEVGYVEGQNIAIEYLLTRASRTGSLPVAKTIGIVVVTALAATAARTFPTITATGRWAKSVARRVNRPESFSAEPLLKEPAYESQPQKADHSSGRSLPPPRAGFSQLGSDNLLGVGGADEVWTLFFVSVYLEPPPANPVVLIEALEAVPNWIASIGSTDLYRLEKFNCKVSELRRSDALVDWNAVTEREGKHRRITKDFCEPGDC